MTIQQDPPDKARREPNDFLSAPRPFAELDLVKIKKNLDLVREGKERGKKNLPPKNSTSFDEIEQKIISLIEGEQQSSFHFLSDRLNLYQQRIASLDLENEAINIIAAAQHASTEFVVKVDEGKAALFTLWRNVCMIENQWNDFRKQHGLQYPADYPISRLWNFAIIVVILAVESILNGSFLARGLETGLIGGILQAFIIAAANVTFGFFVGDCIVRYLLHRNYLLRALAIVELPVSCGIAIFFNLLVGHYRDALGGPDPVNASSMALNTFAAHPFVLGALQSWVLFGMGIFFFLVAAADGFKIDDPYPGYGKISRKHEEIIQEYTDEKANVIDNLSYTRNRALEYIQQVSQNLAEERAEFTSLMENSRKLIQYFEVHRNDLNRSANELLTVYRNANKQARSVGAPPYFDENYALLNPPLPDRVNETLLNNHIEKTSAALKAAIHQVNIQFERAAGEFRKIGEFAKGNENALRSASAT